MTIHLTWFFIYMWSTKVITHYKDGLLHVEMDKPNPFHAFGTYILKTSSTLESTTIRSLGIIKSRLNTITILYMYLTKDECDNYDTFDLYNRAL